MHAIVTTLSFKIQVYLMDPTFSFVENNNHNYTLTFQFWTFKLTSHIFNTTMPIAQVLLRFSIQVSFLSERLEIASLGSNPWKKQNFIEWFHKRGREGGGRFLLDLISLIQNILGWKWPIIKLVKPSTFQKPTNSRVALAHLRSSLQQYY